MNTSPSSSFYQPTPLEEAYANYLLDKVFHITTQDAIIISGRTAVPFFTTSGVERTILRNAWSVADPQGLGKLTSKHQLCIVLRLVALAQAGWISSGEGLLQVLQQSSSNAPPPLPTFSSIEIPSTPFLMTTYGTAPQLMSSAPVAAAAIVPISVSDAFDSLVEVADAPLPTLPSAPLEEEEEDHGGGPLSAITTTDTMETDDFGDFEGPTAAVGDDNDMTSEHSAVAPVEQPPVAIPDAEDDFDDFCEAPPTAAEDTTAPPVSETGDKDHIMSAFDDLVRNDEAPAPLVDEGDFDGFVEAPGVDDSEAAAAAAPPSDTTKNAVIEDVVVDKMSAFDSLVGIEQLPPPSLDDATPAAVLVVEDEEDVDGLLVVEEPASAEPSEKEVLPPSSDADKNTLENDDKMSAFDALVDVEPMPLPSMRGMVGPTRSDVSDAFYSAKTDLSSSGGGAFGSSELLGGADDDDDFGDFAGASEDERQQPDNMDTTDSKEAGIRAEDDEFGVFEGQQLEPSPPLETTDKETTGAEPSDPLSFHAQAAAVSDGESTEQLKEPSSSAEKGDENVTRSFPSKEDSHAPGMQPPVAAVDDDPFAAFDALAPTPSVSLPDITSFSYDSSTTAEQGETLNVLSTLEKADAAGVIQCSEESAVAEGLGQPDDKTGREEEGDDDDFGDFEAADVGHDAPASPAKETSVDLLNFSMDVSEAAEEPKSQIVVDTERLTTDEPEWGNSDDFGDFESPSQESAAAESAEKQDEDKLDDDGDIFGGSAAATASSYIPSPEKLGGNSTGVFAIFPTGAPDESPPQESAAVESAEKQDEDKVEDDGDVFGAFGAANASSYIPSPEKLGGNSTGDFVNFPSGAPDDQEEKLPVRDIVAEDDGPSGVDVGGDLSLSVKEEVMAAAQHEPATTEPTSLVDLPDEEPETETQEAALPTDIKANDSFGDFHTPVASNSDDWGAAMPAAARSNDFAQFDTDDITSDDVPKVEEADAGFDADFGDFEGGEPQEPPVSEPAEEGGWNAFSEARGPKEVTAASSSAESLEEMRDHIQAMSSLLPESLRSGKNGPVDFVASFERNVGVGTDGGGLLSLEEQTKMDPGGASQRLERARRCCRLHTLLTSTHTQHASSHWTQTIMVARDELAMASFLIQDAKGLSSVERRHVFHSLQTMISGLGEYVRVVRSVVATMGDLLGLETSTLLTKENWPTAWSSVALLELALEVEDLWKEIQKEAHSLGLEKVTLESLVEIRTLCVSRGASYPLCQLTLQPLAPVESGTTKSQVTWNDKEFMACAANFWSHKVSTTVP